MRIRLNKKIEPRFPGIELHPEAEPKIKEFTLKEDTARKKETQKKPDKKQGETQGGQEK